LLIAPRAVKESVSIESPSCENSNIGLDGGTDPLSSVHCGPD
jgi:hypothetical protein